MLVRVLVLMACRLAAVMPMLVRAALRAATRRAALRVAVRVLRAVTGALRARDGASDEDGRRLARCRWPLAWPCALGGGVAKTWLATRAQATAGCRRSWASCVPAVSELCVGNCNC